MHDKIFAGQTAAKTEFWNQSMTLGLKRQLKDERALYKALSEEHKKL